MRKILILTAICFVYSCDGKKASSIMGDIEKTGLHKQADIDSVKRLISGSFQDIFSDFDSSKVSGYYTADFMLLESGVVWNIDSIDNYIKRKQANKPKYRRLNRFDFLKSVHNQNTIWIAYNNYATFVQAKDTLGGAHWLESVIAIKENNRWRIQQLHSTSVRK